jgi:hypothetical protein
MAKSRVRFDYRPILLLSKRKGRDVVTALNYLNCDWGLSNRISCDNGLGSSGDMMDRLAHTHKVERDVIQQGKPTYNALLEPFNGRFNE